MRLIENACGKRRVWVVAGLFLCSWLAVMLVVTLFMDVLDVLSALAKSNSTSGIAASTSMPEMLTRWASRALDTLKSGALWIVAPFFPSVWQKGEFRLLPWLAYMAILTGGTMMSLPLVGLRHRGRLPLRWSIVSGGLLGGLLGVGVIFTLMDLVRLAGWPPPLGWDKVFLDSGNSATVTALICWVISGWMWARALARAGRTGQPDVIARFVKRLFSGTVVELAIAAPTYALAIRRSNCYCAWGSWFAIIVGVAILTILCGPAVVLLWTREARLQWIRKACPKCGYPSRSGSTVCSECGNALPAT